MKNIDNKGKVNIPHVSSVTAATPVYVPKVSSDKLVKGEVDLKTVTNPIANRCASNVNSLYSPNLLLSAYSGPLSVYTMISKNPKVKEILDSHSCPLKVEPSNLTQVSKSHLQTTTAYALQIANQLKLPTYEKKILEQACVFHDFGKILVPKDLLIKPGELTPEEKAVVDMHAQLGYELLSTTGMDERVLNLVKNHHMPQKENDDILGKILSVADIYSALREQRSYKMPLSDREAISILDQKAKDGEVSTEVVNALKYSIFNSIVA